MRKIAVIGGGLAGLSSAVYLSEKGFNVTLFEATPKLGGRAFAFKYKDKGLLDNGQHVLMGCYNYTLDYLNKVGTYNKIYIYDKLDLSLRKKGGQNYSLKSIGKFYPINLILGLLSYKALSLKTRLKLISLLLQLPIQNSKNLELLSTKEWLRSIDSSDNVFSSFWDLIINATMNTSSEFASAETFQRILKEVFLNGNFASSIIIPDTDLTTLFCDGAERFIKRHSGNIKHGERVTMLNMDGHSIHSIETSKGIYTDFEAVVAAVPHYMLKNITTPPPQIMDIDYSYSSIITVHIWLKENPFKENFYGLIDSKMQWLFNHNDYVTTVTSDGNDIVDLSKDEITELALSELQNYFTEFNRKIVSEVKIVKEKKATFIPDAKTESKRKKIPMNEGNLFFAGDWTNTGFPGTIEGAVKSGKLAADLISENFKSN